MERSPRDLELHVDRLIDVLTRFAAGDWDARAERNFCGDPMDVLAFMINATIEEIGHLVEEQRRQREELERAQTELVHAAKLAALGKLAGGIAHELNQPLTVFSSLIGLALERDGSLGQEDLELLAAATARMSRIVDGVRTFSRRTALRKSEIDPMRPVHAAVDLLGRRLRADGHDLVVVEPSPGTIVGDSDRLQQVIVNLLVNSADAFAEKGMTGRIRIEGRWVEDGFEYLVEDDGPGIKPDDREHVFEPFFTTKEGVGMGLGLSVSHGIVEEHGGEMRLEPSDWGARFRIRLPAQVRIEKAGRWLVNLRPSILVADDDALVLRVMARVLGAWGQAEVVLVSGGPQALEALGGRRFDLVISDVKMPDVDGFAVVEAARRLNPEAKVLLVTGHASDQMTERARTLAIDVLRKPFTAHAFVRTVERHLSGYPVRLR